MRGEEMADNVQHKIARNRPPRVQITYDVEVGNAIEKAEIPFVVGIMADLSGFGDNVPGDREPLKSKDRPFVEIDRDNFTDVMAKISPGLPISGALDDNGNPTADGRLVFRSLDEFNPVAIVGRVKTLKELQTQRTALRDVLTKLDSNDELYAELLKRVKEGNFGALRDAASTRLEQLQAVEGATDGKDKDQGSGGGKKPEEKAAT
jgi:type VI secretion system protein ImpB